MPDEVSGSTWTRVAKTVAGLAGSVLSFRVLVALTTSVAVTGAVAGPLAFRVANSEEAAPAPSTTQPPRTSAPSQSTTPEPPSSSTTSSTTSTTTTTTSTTTTTTSTTTTTTLPTTTIQPPSSDGIFVREDVASGASGLLNGAYVGASAFIWFAEPADSVAFYLDSPVDDTPNRVDNVAPFDFAAGANGDAAPFDPATVDVGYHTLTVVVTGGTGPSTRVAVFTTDPSFAQ